MARSLRPLDVYPITVRTLDVFRVADVAHRVCVASPSAVRNSPDTAANGYPVAAFRFDGFDDEGKLILQHPDVVLLRGTDAGRRGAEVARDNPHLLFCTYTIRRWDPAAGEVDLDFVKYGVGPATSWAYSEIGPVSGSDLGRSEILRPASGRGEIGPVVAARDRRCP